MTRNGAYQPVVAFAPVAQHVSVDEPGDLAMSDGWENARAAADLCDRKLDRWV